MTGANPDNEAWDRAGAFLKRFASSTANQRSRLVKKVPLPDFHVAALRHPDPIIRKEFLYFLDHHANDESTAVFASALHDPIDFVRNAALHSISCESCRTTELCATDVVPAVVGVLEGDPSAGLRMRAIPTLFRLAGRDRRAWEAIRRAAEHDPDAIVRRAAAEALRGHLAAPRKRFERYQRRHDRLLA